MAHDISADGNDQLHLADMAQKVVDETGQVPQQIVADAGYYSEEGVTSVETLGCEAFVATARSKHEDPPPVPRGRLPANLTAKQRMQRKLLTKRGRKVYAKRKTSVEPVFGQVKQGRGFRAFLMRGLGLVAKEWAMVCTAHNIVKLWRAAMAGARS